MNENRDLKICCGDGVKFSPCEKDSESRFDPYLS